MRLTPANERGDTIIEVIFAFTVFAMVIVGSMTIMNQGTNMTQRALEITQVRQQMDAQAEAIRYIHQAYVASYQEGTQPSGVAAIWPAMTSRNTGKGVANPSEFGATNNGRCPTNVPAERPFILNARKVQLWQSEPTMSPPESGSLPPFAQVAYDNNSNVTGAYGIWVEAVPSSQAAATGYVDFHIRACWAAAGSANDATLGTIVRLYEPR